MATVITKEGWTKDEQAIFMINRSFQPPFHIETVGGNGVDDEEQGFSAGDRYLILRKLKIESVKASTDRGTLKIPLDYKGKFCLVSESQGDEELLSLQEILSTSSGSPQQVRLGNPQQHGKLFLEKLHSHSGKRAFIEKLHGKVDHNLTVSDRVTQEYYLGKSLDGTLVITFSTGANMRFLVKDIYKETEEVKRLQFKMDELNYDIFLAIDGSDSTQFFELKDAIIPPKTPPKPKGTSQDNRTDEQKQKRSQIDEPTEKNVYETMASVSKLNLQRSQSNPTTPTKPKPKQRQLKQKEDPGIAASIDSRKRLSPPPSPKPRRKTSESRDSGGEDDGLQRPYSYDPSVAKSLEQQQDGSQIARHRKKSDKRPKSLHDEVVNRVNFNQGGMRGSPPGSPTSPRTGRKPPPLPAHPGNHVPEFTSPASPPNAYGSDSDSEYEALDSQNPSSGKQKKLGTLIKNIKSPFKHKKQDEKTKSHPGYQSDGMADDELTEDPYPDVVIGQRVPKKKHHRNPYDKLPEPGHSQPSSPTFSDRGRSSESDASEYEMPYGHLKPTPKPRSNRPSSSPANLYTEQHSTGEYAAVIHPSTTNEEFPSELCHLTVEGIVEILEKLNMPGDVIATFRKDQIDGQLFVCLDETILEQMGVGALYKLKLIKFKNGWRPAIN